MLNRLIATMRDFLRPRRALILENLALRQQILVLQRTNPKPPFRDRDRAFWVALKIYGDAVATALDELGIEQVVTAVRCPWQNGYCERVVGTLKRECLNHMIVFNEAHARRVVMLLPGK